MRLRDLTAEVVDAWLVALTAVGPAGKPRLGPTSARLVRKVLSMALEEAVQRGRMARNPVVLTQPPRRDRTYKKLGWTLEEARTFLAAAADHRLYAASISAWSPGSGGGRLSPSAGPTSTSPTGSCGSSNNSPPSAGGR